MDEINFSNSLTAGKVSPSLKDISSPSQENREVKKVIKGNATFAKPSLLRRIKNTFISDDASNVGSYIVDDIIIPSIQDGIMNSIISAATMIFGRGRGPYYGYRPYNNVSRASWRQPDRYDNTPYDRYGYRRDDRVASDYRSTRSYKDVEIPSYEEALDVIHELYSLLENYHMVRVSDYFSAAGLTGEFTDNQWGWYDLPPRIAPRRTMTGRWTIDLPRPEPLNR
ncbi:MAG: hypothetical protein J6Y86_04165 [Pseudobutyrivibrio sp.]|nr:hypothetical protein [Pseudobutyrivibrio sp.]